LRAALEHEAHCGVKATTSYALRRDSDNMYCRAVCTSYFILLSSLRLVGAQYAKHVLRGGVLGVRHGDKEGQSHDRARDSADVLIRALYSLATVLSAVPRSDYRRDEITTRQHQ
jgi:hypothetical protein